MTKIEAETIIREAAERHGFTVDRYLFDGALYIHEYDTHYLNFVIHRKTIRVDRERNGCTFQLTFSATLATMGGNPTPDDLLQASEIIHDGAMLIKELNGAELICTEEL